MHSPNFEKIKYYYDNGLWSLHRVQEAVQKNWITQEEYNLIIRKEDLN